MRQPDGRPVGALVRAQDVQVAGRLRQPVTLHPDGADRLLLTGANGAGKSTLLSVLAGRLTAALSSTPAAVVVATHDRRLLADLAGWPRLGLRPAESAESAGDRPPGHREGRPGVL